MSNTRQYDAIVIGAGLGGLSTALHLAKKSMNVLVLEKHPKVGGYAQNYQRAGFDFDVSLHVLSALNEGGGLRHLLEYLQVIDKLDVTEYAPMWTSVFPDATYRLPARTEGRVYLKELFPKERDGIDKYLAIMESIIEANTQLYWDGNIDLNHFFPARYFKKNYQQLLEECFTDRRLFGILGQLWQSTGLPNELCSANWTAEVFGSFLLTGNYYVKGGGQRISSAMAETLCEAGGTVRTSALVEKVLLKDRNAVGVQLESGEKIFAPSIISNANPIQTYLSLVGREHLAKPFVYKLGTYEQSCSLLTLYLGLDCSGKEAGVMDHTTFVNFDYNYMRTWDAAHREEHHATDYVISDYTDEASGTHPKGKGIVQILEVADGKRWTEISRNEYLDKKRTVTDTILAKVARRYPNLASHIEIAELGTPRSMERYSRNRYGSVYGFAQTPDQADNWRFSVNAIFPGLYFSGAWGRGGGGGYMGSIVNGRVAASQVIAKQAWNGPEKTFDVAPREPFRIRRVVDGATRVETTDSLSPKRYQRQIAETDLSPAGELSAEASVRLLSETANTYIEENKSFLSKSWPDLNADVAWHTSFFQMRFVFVPFAVLSPGDTVSIDVTFEPSASGKGQFTQDIYLEVSGKKLANAGGRVIIREMQTETMLR